MLLLHYTFICLIFKVMWNWWARQNANVLDTIGSKFGDLVAYGSHGALIERSQWNSIGRLTPLPLDKMAAILAHDISMHFPERKW